MSDAISPFEIQVGDEILDDLKQRLAATRLPQQIEGTDWAYGAEISYLEELIAYWRDKYDWRVEEAALNLFDHFTTAIDDQRIHFIHQRSTHDHAVPLLLLHGWPGSVVEFMKVIGPLTQPEAHGGDAADAFHVVAPSLPGYGFSEFTKTPGYDTHRMAENFAVLMSRLDYDRYGVEGGDWGAVIANSVSILDAEHVLGLHTTMPLAFPPPGHDPKDLSEREQADLADLADFDQNGTGYQKIQGSKPQTLGFGLNDSPAGLCAWITEKFHGWTDCDGHVENAIDRDQLLTNVMVYWITQTITSSTRLYYETFKSGRVGIVGAKVEVPTGVARFPREIMRYPRKWVEQSYNVTHWTEMPKGGHFAAMEQPDLFVTDVRKFFGTLR
ncbi:MAG: alpha/beta fold hydrolase [Myxococcota bacterium]|nr:alpha/beta fold hydrolase [Myxococcota bacterium]